MRLIEGSIVTDGEDDTAALHAEIQKLRDDLTAARRDVKDAGRALLALRHQLTPLYRALQAVFGELDTVEGAPDQAYGNVYDRHRNNEYWDQWKARLGPNCGKVIDALKLGGEMTITSIRVAAKIGKDTAYKATSKMGQAGILVRNGSKFSLKSPD